MKSKPDLEGRKGERGQRPERGNDRGPRRDGGSRGGQGGGMGNPFGNIDWFTAAQQKKN
jgi:hypothetical protein